MASSTSSSDRPRELGHVARRGRAAQVGGQVVDGVADAHGALLQVAGHAHGPALVAEVALELAGDGGHREARERARLGVVAVDGLDQAQAGDLLEIVQGLAGVAVARRPGGAPAACGARSGDRAHRVLASEVGHELALHGQVPRTTTGWKSAATPPSECICLIYPQLCPGLTVTGQAPRHSGGWVWLYGEGLDSFSSRVSITHIMRRRRVLQANPCSARAPPALIPSGACPTSCARSSTRWSSRSSSPSACASPGCWCRRAAPRCRPTRASCWRSATGRPTCRTSRCRWPPATTWCSRARPACGSRSRTSGCWCAACARSWA